MCQRLHKLRILLGVQLSYGIKSSVEYRYAYDKIQFREIYFDILILGKDGIKIQFCSKYKLSRTYYVF